MGMVIGKVFAVITKPIKNFNIENRAHKVISKTKPVVAPMYNSNVEELETILKEHPEVVEKLSKKDASLDHRLKDVFVSSPDPTQPERPLSSRYNPNKPLPLNRRYTEENDYGVEEPAKITPGFTTLRLALKFITEHQAQPDLHTASTIAAQYKLNQEDVKKILKYYGSFELYIPDKTAGRFATPMHMPKLGDAIKESLDAKRKIDEINEEVPKLRKKE